MKQIISIAHSPDSDDLCMFWALRHGIVSDTEFDFCINSFNTDILNSFALTSSHDVIAISAALYPQIENNYNILPHGASFARSYGPKLLSKNYSTLESLQTKKISIPGFTTTSCALLRMILPEAELIEIPIEPHEKVFAAICNNEVDAGLIIHEGQVTYKDYGLDLICDLGLWWGNTYNTPLPLGINVISNSLDPQITDKVSKLIQQSIIWGIDNRELIADELLADARNRNVKNFTRQSLLKYLSMYANDDTKQTSAELDNALLCFFKNLKSQNEKA